MDKPPSGWYPDPYGVPGLLRWWDGSTWTQHTHTGTAGEPSDASGPVTLLDATRIGAASNEAPRTAIERLVPQPTTVQPAVVQPTTVQPSVVQTTMIQPTTVQPWGAEPPYAGGQADQFGTQVLPVTHASWSEPGGYDDRTRQRRRRLLLGALLVGGTAVALALIALLVSALGSSGTPAPTAATSAASAATPTVQATSATGAQTPSATGTAGGLADSVSGLSYPLLAAPWTSGCPAGLSSQQTLTWTSGESAQAGQFNNNGTETTWYGEACSAPLPQQYGYTGVADLEPTAMNLVNQFDGPYYGTLNHQRTQLASTPVSVSGHPAWEVKYLETYPNASSMGLAFNSEEGAVVVADQGSGLPPAVFFVSMPSNLGVANVDALVSSLTLTATSPTQSASPQPSSSQPSATQSSGNDGHGHSGGGGNNP
jgi:Protein of unknown function (DUF2510)